MNHAIIFDMDGTLFRTDSILELALEDTFQYLHAINEWEGAAPLKEYREIMGVPLPVVWDTLLKTNSDEVKKMTDDYFLNRLIVHIKLGHGELYPNVLQTLTTLHEQHYSIFIASNGLIAYLQAIAEHFQLKRWVKELFSIEQITSLNKSDLVQQIKLKYNIEHGVVVGDRLSDIKAAKDNGLVSIGCKFDFAKDDELVYADAVISNMDELEGCIQRFIL